MRGQIQEILRRFGQRVVLRPREDALETRAFLQPVTRRNEQMPEEMMELGSLDGRLWLYLGVAEIADGDSILWNGDEFRVRSSRPWYVGDQLLYWWAALERAKEAEA